MANYDDLPVNQAIELYYEKHYALRTGNLTRLIEMKNEHPEIFNKEKDRQIRELILYAKAFEKSERYQQLRKLMLEEQE